MSKVSNPIVTHPQSQCLKSPIQNPKSKVTHPESQSPKLPIRSLKFKSHPSKVSKSSHPSKVSNSKVTCKSLKVKSHPYKVSVKSPKNYSQFLAGVITGVIGKLQTFLTLLKQHRQTHCGRHNFSFHTCLLLLYYHRNLPRFDYNPARQKITSILNNRAHNRG